jgi:hypothetical protein
LIELNELYPGIITINKLTICEGPNLKYTVEKTNKNKSHLFENIDVLTIINHDSFEDVLKLL